MLFCVPLQPQVSQELGRDSNATFHETLTTTSDQKLGTPESIGVANLKCDDGIGACMCGSLRVRMSSSACLRGVLPSLTLTLFLRVAKLVLGYIKESLA